MTKRLILKATALDHTAIRLMTDMHNGMTVIQHIVLVRVMMEDRKKSVPNTLRTLEILKQDQRI